MKIVFITEGIGEFKSLPKLYNQLQQRSGHTLLSPLKINVPPDAAVSVVARECKSRIVAAVARRADVVIIILDREQQSDCPGKIAQAIEVAIRQACPVSVTVRVVLKDRSFENWLIADLDALRAQPKRYAVAASLVRAIEPDKADRCDAHSLLKAAAVGSQYEKVQDAAKICARLNVEKAALHSRSFRHLLHVLNDTKYADQCRIAKP